MKQTLIYIIILAALGFGVWYIFFRDDSNLFTSRDAGFTIRDTSSVGRIFIANSQNETIKLVRTDSGWKLNDRYKALPSAVQQLLFTLNAQVAQRPVPEIAHNTVVRSLTKSNKVEVYDLEGRKLRVFYVGESAANSGGTYMLMEGGSRPYVVNIPGFEGYLTPRYQPNERYWRDRTVFDIDSTGITRVSVKYNLEPLNSFTVSREGGKALVAVDPALMEGKTQNDHRANNYLSFFKSVSCESIANGLIGVRESISTVPQYCSMEVSGRNGYHQYADIYFMPKNKRSKNYEVPITDTADYYDPDHFYAVINNKADTVAIQKFVFNKFFRKGYEFFEADAPQKK